MYRVLDAAPDVRDTDVPEFLDTVPAVLDTEDDAVLLTVLLPVEELLLTAVSPEALLRETPDMAFLDTDEPEMLLERDTDELREPYEPVELREP